MACLGWSRLKIVKIETQIHITPHKTRHKITQFSQSQNQKSLFHHQFEQKKITLLKTNIPLNNPKPNTKLHPIVTESLQLLKRLVAKRISLRLPVVVPVGMATCIVRRSRVSGCRGVGTESHRSKRIHAIRGCSFAGCGCYDGSFAELIPVKLFIQSDEEMAPPVLLGGRISRAKPYHFLVYC